MNGGIRVFFLVDSIASPLGTRAGFPDKSALVIDSHRDWLNKFFSFPETTLREILIQNKSELLFYYNYLSDNY